MGLGSTQHTNLGPITVLRIGEMGLGDLAREAVPCPEGPCQAQGTGR